MSSQVNHLHGLENTLYRYQAEFEKIEPDAKGVAGAERKRLQKLVRCYSELVRRQKVRLASGQ